MMLFLASLYDPLGLASQGSLVGKLLHREVSDQHLPWDQKAPKAVAKQWKKSERSLPDHGLADFKETIEKRSIYTCSETKVELEQQLPCMQWSIKLLVSTKDYWLQNHAWQEKLFFLFLFPKY